MNLKALILVAASGLIAFGAVSAHAASRPAPAKPAAPRTSQVPPLFEGRNATVEPSLFANAARNGDAAISRARQYDARPR